MGTVLASAVIRRASVLLLDTEFIRWPQAELLEWLNDGQRELVTYKPTACVRNIDFKMVKGTKQKLPADGNSLVDVPRNAAGAPVRATSREVMDALMDWHSAKPTDQVKHFYYNPDDPKTFYVYPASTGNNLVELVYNAVPAECALSSPINVDDVYVGALVNYLLYRAYSKDTEYAPNATSAATAYKAYLAPLVGKNPTET